MIQMIERAMDHQGFSVIECLSECVEFFPGAFDPANPRKGGAFSLIEEKKWDNTPEDELRHDVTDELAAYKLAQLPFPGVFGVFYESRSPNKKRAREEVDRHNPREVREPQRFGLVAENIRSHEINAVDFRLNGATGASDIAGAAARVAVERCGSSREQ